jgi:uncharacterized glyoxalase superfamily protein PhnB
MKIIGLRPMLQTEDLPKTIAFYERHLVFKCCGLFPDENPCWASLMNGNVEIMFSTPNAHTEFTKATLTGSIYIETDDVDALWESVKDEVEIVYPPEDFDFGMREFGIKDCNGYILNIGQIIE